MTARQRFATLLTLGLTLAAVAATAAQAADRPDNRAGPLGVGTPATVATAVRPDDRSGPLGVGTAAAIATATRPDDRAGPFGVGDDVVSRYVNNHPAAVRPDDRSGIRGVGTGSAGVVTSASAHDESFWGAGQLAGAAFLGAIAVGLLGFALMRHRRSAVAALQS